MRPLYVSSEQIYVRTKDAASQSYIDLSRYIVICKSVCEIVRQRVLYLNSSSVVMTLFYNINISQG